MTTLAIVGATGLVGQECLACLEEDPILSSKIKQLRLFASEKSAGKTVEYRGESLVVESLAEATFEGIDYAIFAVGAALSLEFIPKAVEAGVIVVDNSSAYRYDPEVPLVVPEVNAIDIHLHKGIIANPNCSTIQLVLPLAYLHWEVPIRRLIVSTYQSASGAGDAGESSLHKELKEHIDSNDFSPSSDPTGGPHQRRLGLNVIPQIDHFLENGYTKEEMKIVWETHKILHAPDMEISATAVRVPVFRGHSEAVTIDLAEEISRAKVCELLSDVPGLRLLDSPSFDDYPTPLDATGNNWTWVGRVRMDVSRPNTVHLWIVSDNLRKGAAKNALQIVENIIDSV